MDIEVVPLTGILKLFSIFVLIDIAMFSEQCVLLLELLRRLLTDSISLLRKGFDSDVRVEGSAIVHEFEDVAFLELLSHFHCIKIIGICNQTVIFNRAYKLINLV